MLPAGKWSSLLCRPTSPPHGDGGGALQSLAKLPSLHVALVHLLPPPKFSGDYAFLGLSSPPCCCLSLASSYYCRLYIPSSVSPSLMSSALRALARAEPEPTLPPEIIRSILSFFDDICVVPTYVAVHHLPGKEAAPAPVGDAATATGTGTGTGAEGDEPRQGADLQKQIGLFVEMSTPFFKASRTLREEGCVVVLAWDGRCLLCVVWCVCLPLLVGVSFRDNDSVGQHRVHTRCFCGGIHLYLV